MMDAATKKNVETRLKRVEGQIAALRRMVGQDSYCVDVLLQVAAARAALDGLGKQLLRNHVETCVADAFASGRPKERKEKADELIEVFSKFAHIGGR